MKWDKKPFPWINKDTLPLREIAGLWRPSENFVDILQCLSVPGKVIVDENIFLNCIADKRAHQMLTHME